MERYEIGDNPRLIALLEAAERGEEAALTKNGVVVGHMRSFRRSSDVDTTGRIDVNRLEQLRSRLRLLPGDGASLVREARDERDW